MCDDDAKIAEWLEKQILERYEAKIVKFTAKKIAGSDGERGKREFPHILILDVVLGAENGIALAKAMQQINGQMQVIFITGYTDYVSDVLDSRCWNLRFMKMFCGFRIKIFCAWKAMAAIFISTKVRRQSGLP